MNCDVHGGGIPVAADFVPLDEFERGAQKNELYDGHSPPALPLPPQHVESVARLPQTAPPALLIADVSHDEMMRRARASLAVQSNTAVVVRQVCDVLSIVLVVALVLFCAFVLVRRWRGRRRASLSR